MSEETITLTVTHNPADSRLCTCILDLDGKVQDPDCPWGDHDD